MQIPDPDESRRTYTAQVQPHLSEPVLAIGFLSPGGQLGQMARQHAGASAVRMGSPLAAFFLRKKQAADRKASSDVTCLAAVGATTVALFPYPADRSEFSVQAPPQVWPRAGMRVVADKPGRMTRQVHVDLATGEHHDFEVFKGVKTWEGWSDQMLELLLSPAQV